MTISDVEKYVKEQCHADASFPKNFVKNIGREYAKEHSLHFAENEELMPTRLIEILSSVNKLDVFFDGWQIRAITKNSGVKISVVGAPFEAFSKKL